jgi:predicted Zn-dependent protease
LESAPDSVRALNWHGWVSYQLDHRSESIRDYQRILELQPGRSVVRLRLAEILVESTRHSEAEPHLERLREEMPDNPDVKVALARCRRVQSRTDESRELLEEVLREHPDHFEALIQLSKIELDARHFTEAEHRLRTALLRSPDDPEARYGLYQSLRGQPGRQREAQQELELWKLNRQTQDRLTQLLRSELGRQPNNPDLAREAGELLLKKGEEQRGLYWLHKALDLNPRHVPTLRILVAFYDRKKDTEKAAECRQRLASLGAAP